MDKSNKIALTFDLDNTIFDITCLYQEAWEKYKKNNPKDNTDFELPKHWDYRKDWPLEACLLLDKELNEDIWRVNFGEKQPIASAICGLMNHPLFDVYFVTDRYIGSYEGTVYQIHRNIDENIPLDKIINCYVKKIEVLKEIKNNHKAVIHFDDKPETIVDCVKNNIFSVMISNNSTPYNHNVTEVEVLFDNNYYLGKEINLFTAISLLKGHYNYIIDTIEGRDYSDSDEFTCF